MRRPFGAIGLAGPQHGTARLCIQRVIARVGIGKWFWMLVIYVQLLPGSLQEVSAKYWDANCVERYDTAAMIDPICHWGIREMGTSPPLDVGDGTCVEAELSRVVDKRIKRDLS